MLFLAGWLMQMISPVVDAATLRAVLAACPNRCSLAIGGPRFELLDAFERAYTSG
jgi:hypothetical protein